MVTLVNLDRHRMPHNEMKMESCALDFLIPKKVITLDPHLIKIEWQRFKSIKVANLY